MDTSPPQPNQSAPNPSQDPLDVTNKSDELDVSASPQTVTALATDFSIAKSHIASGKNSKSPVIIISVTVVVLLLAVLGAAYYYFVVRLPDTYYTQAASGIDVLVNDIKATSGVTDTLQKLGDHITDADLKHATDVRLQAQDYSVNLNKLKSSDALMRDGPISEYYKNNASKIETYGSSVNDILSSIEIFETAALKWNKFSVAFNSGSIKTIDDYDARSKDIVEYLQEHSTVSVKDFNDKIYSTQRSVSFSTILDVRTFVLAYAGGDQKQYNLAFQKVTKDAKSDDDVKKQSRAYTFKLSADPTSTLQDLQAKLNERKATFWR